MEGDLFLSHFPQGHSCACSEGAQLYWMEPAQTVDYERLLSGLEELGFSCYSTRTEGENCFCFLVRQDTLVSVSFVPGEKKLRMVTEAATALPPKPSECKRLMPTMVTQLHMSNLEKDCGMCYVIRLCDGRFVLIDAAFDEYEETQRLLEVLREQNTVYPKPVIAAWFITHSHSDHFGALVRLMKEFPDAVVFGDFIYNWPNPDFIYPQNMTDHSVFDELVRKMPGARILHPRSGQQFCYGDAVFDVLFCCDDLYPEFIPNFNDTSLITRMTVNGRRILWMGDGQAQASDCLLRRYGADTLQCEILQVGHHGYSGGSTALHKLVDPTALLWPVPDFWFHEVRHWETNTYFMESRKLEKTYLSGRYTTVLDMEKPLPPVPQEPQYAPGAVIYSQDFSGSRVIDLGFTAVTGGKTGYVAAQLALQQGSCIWKNSGPGPTVLEILRPGLLETVPGYTLTFSGTVMAEPKMFGMLVNHAHPTAWKQEAFLAVPLPAGAFSLILTVDFSAGKAVVVCNGQEVLTADCTPQERNGLYLVLKDGELCLHDLEVTAKRDV